MGQCLKISFYTNQPKDFLEAIIQKTARTLGIEGTVQTIDSESVSIVACSSKETLEQFLDVIHREATAGALRDIAIEPFLKNKDYRGVFRVLD